MDGMVITTTETHPRVGYRSKQLWKNKGIQGAAKMMTLYHQACKAAGKDCIFRMWRITQDAESMRAISKQVPDDAVFSIKNTGGDYWLSSGVAEPITSGIGHQQPLMILIASMTAGPGFSAV